MRITYSKIAYVTVNVEILDLLERNMNSFAQGDGNLCCNIDTIREELEEIEAIDHDDLTETDSKIHKLLSEVEKELSKEDNVGDVIFCD